MSSRFTGIGVSQGVAAAPAVVVAPAIGVEVGEPKTTDFDAASAQVHQALSDVAAGLTARAAQAPADAKAVLEAGAMMASDPGLASGIDNLLQAGKGVTNAVHDAVEEYAAMFESLGGYMAERVTDLRDVRDRVISRLRGVPEPGVPQLTQPSILIARDLAPAETAMLSADTCVGIVTSEGGPTSHTAILAAQLGIPAVVQVGELRVANGAEVAIDGGAGLVILDPTKEEVDALKLRQQRRQSALSDSDAPGATKDGVPIALLANIGTVADAESAAAKAVEGVGLFRTEFLFLDRESAPTLKEQTATYTKVLEAFGPRRVIVRTLDAGADKPLKFADLGPEENPALGKRGLRLSMIRQDLLDTQLEALAAAYKATGADLRVMAPMIANKPEADWFAERARAAGLPKVGVMIEIPAAALRAEQVLANLDFASLGTNDLQQYTMATDRMEGALARLLNYWEPAVLDVIAAACSGAKAAGKPIGVCGESGGDPGLALVLVGLGVSSLSMAPAKVQAVRTVLAAHTMEDCVKLAAIARKQETWEEARQAVLDAADPVLKDVL
ncbi:MAG: phosphoenolpyruvate--protein phosphotransferase [Propionibacteriaceae bacterium]|jgi:phosphotransferase system enzyme I (PtsI)|nr:phosphoenolpyruvate--protein phosphotransferase [Propionibacteriaceae bacterium]